MNTLPLPKPIQLTEKCEDWAGQLTVDDDNRLVRNIALSGTISRNGYTYSEQSLQDAVALYADKPVFLDHAADKTRPHERSTKDLVGSIVSPRYIDGRIRGDIRVLETDSGHTFLKLVNSKSPGVGMSHVVLAQRSADGSTVLKIEDVISVDAVINPATTNTFHESEQTTDPEIARLREHLQNISQQRDALLQERDNLRRSISTLQNEQILQRMLRESKLPSETVTESFLTQLRKAETEVEKLSLINDRYALIESHAQHPPIYSHPRLHTETSTDTLFINTIRTR